MTKECRVLGRTFPRYFRRQGAESDLALRVVDTPPQIPNPQSLHKLCPGGVHVLAIVMRADLPHEDTYLLHCAKVTSHKQKTHFMEVVYCPALCLCDGVVSLCGRPVFLSV